VTYSLPSSTTLWISQACPCGEHHREISWYASLATRACPVSDSPEVNATRLQQLITCELGPIKNYGEQWMLLNYVAHVSAFHYFSQMEVIVLTGNCLSAMPRMTKTRVMGQSNSQKRNGVGKVIPYTVTEPLL
jgi:hypothetical protein